MIRDEAKFSELSGRISQVFLSTARLPTRVFRNSYSRFLFADLDWAMSASFWGSIQNISGARDEKILVAVIDPDPVEYFYKEFGAYNFFELSPKSSSDDYWAFLEAGPSDSPADAALYNSEVIVWIPESLDWAIWAQRDLGICVLAFRNDLHAVVPLPAEDWMPVEAALAKLLPMKFGVSEIDPDLSANLRANYAK